MYKTPTNHRDIYHIWTGFIAGFLRNQPLGAWHPIPCDPTENPRPVGSTWLLDLLGFSDNVDNETYQNFTEGFCNIDVCGICPKLLMIICLILFVYIYNKYIYMITYVYIGLVRVSFGHIPEIWRKPYLELELFDNKLMWNQGCISSTLDLIKYSCIQEMASKIQSKLGFVLKTPASNQQQKSPPKTKKDTKPIKNMWNR